MSNIEKLKGEEGRAPSVLMGHTGVALRCLALVLVNAGQPLLVDFLRYHGAAEPSTLLYVLPTYYGMVLVGLVSKTKKSMWRENWSKAFSVCLCDLLHQVAEKGSAAYTITASWSTVWTALLSLLLLHKRLASYQWLGILLICIGFSLKAMQVNFSESSHEAIGILLTLFASVLHGLSFVLNEMFLTGDVRMEGPNLVGMCGLISSSFLTVWMLIWTIPQWDARVLQPIEATNGSIPAIFCGYAGLLILATLRSATLWYLLQHVGAVSAGVLKGARTALVFVLSHYFYCHLQESQCLTSVKTLSAMTCVTGVMIYSGLGYSFILKSLEHLTPTGEGEARQGWWCLWSRDFASRRPLHFQSNTEVVASSAFRSPQLPLLEPKTQDAVKKSGEVGCPHDSDDDLPSFKVGSLVREEEGLEEEKDFMI